MLGRNLFQLLECSLCVWSPLGDGALVCHAARAGSVAVPCSLRQVLSRIIVCQPLGTGLLHASLLGQVMLF